MEELSEFKRRKARMRDKSGVMKFLISKRRDELREKLSILRGERTPPSRLKRKMTKCEIAMEDILKELGVDYEREFGVYFGGSFKYYDFKVGEKLLIEVDGDYWHSNLDSNKPNSKFLLENKRNDVAKTWIAKQRGFRLLRFWESDVLHSRDRVLNEVRDEVGLGIK